MDWKKVLLSDVCELIAGYAFKSKDFGNYADKVIKITHITPPTVDMSSLIGVDMSKYDASKLDKYIARTNDYVLAMTGSIGKIGRIEHGSAYINQRVLLFKPNQCVDKDYLYYVLQQYEFAQYVYNHVDSYSVQPNISANTIGKYQVLMPKLETQQKIGALLRAYDKKIENNRKINENLDEISTTLFSNHYTVDMPLVPLSSIAVIKYGKGLPTKNLIPNGYPVFGGNGVIGYYSSYMYSLPQILVSCRGAASGNVLESYPNSFVTNNSLIIELHDRRYYEFIKRYLLLNKLYKFATGSAQPQITIDNIKDVLVPYPVFHSIEALCVQLNVLSKTAFQIKSENAMLENVRDTLLPRLMSGELDVSNLDI